MVQILERGTNSASGYRKKQKKTWYHLPHAADPPIWWARSRDQRDWGTRCTYQCPGKTAVLFQHNKAHNISSKSAAMKELSMKDQNWLKHVVSLHINIYVFIQNSKTIYTLNLTCGKKAQGPWGISFIFQQLNPHSKPNVSTHPNGGQRDYTLWWVNSTFS